MRRSQIKSASNSKPGDFSNSSSSTKRGPAISRHLLTPCRRLGLPLPKKKCVVNSDVGKFTQNKYDMHYDLQSKDSTVQSPLMENNSVEDEQTVLSQRLSHPRKTNKESLKNHSLERDYVENVKKVSPQKSARTRRSNIELSNNDSLDENSHENVQKVSLLRSTCIRKNNIKHLNDDSFDNDSDEGVQKVSPRQTTCTKKYNIKNDSLESDSDDSPLIHRKKSFKNIKSNKSSKSLQDNENVKDFEINLSKNSPGKPNEIILSNSKQISKNTICESSCLDKTSNMSLISNFDEFVAEVVSTPTLLSPVKSSADDDSNGIPEVTCAKFSDSSFQPKVIIDELNLNYNKTKTMTIDSDEDKICKKENSSSDDDFNCKNSSISKKILVNKIFSSKITKSKENNSKIKEDKSLRKIKSAVNSSELEKKKIRKKDNVKSESTTPRTLSQKSQSDSDDDFAVVSLKNQNSQIPNNKNYITNKIEEIKKRLKQKQKKLLMLQNQNPKVNECLKLEEVTAKWRKSCQEALNELLDFNKKREGCDKISMEELLGLLNIPVQIVKYNPEKMDFE